MTVAEQVQAQAQIRETGTEKREGGERERALASKNGGADGCCWACKAFRFTGLAARARIQEALLCHRTQIQHEREGNGAIRLRPEP